MPTESQRSDGKQTKMTTSTVNLGNNESLSAGIFPQADGAFLAMSYTASRRFKTLRGAQRWLAARGAAK